MVAISHKNLRASKPATMCKSHNKHGREIPRLRRPTFRRSGILENASASSARNDSTRQQFRLTIRDSVSSAEGVDDFAGGVGAGCAREAVAGMRAGATEEEAADRRFVAGPIQDGAHGEELIEG